MLPEECAESLYRTNTTADFDDTLEEEKAPVMFLHGEFDAPQLDVALLRDALM